MSEKKNLKPIPKFKSEDEEREFWATHDSVDHVDWGRAKFASFPNLKPVRKAEVVAMSSEDLDVMSLRGVLKPSVRGVTLKDMEGSVRRGATRRAAVLDERVEETPG